MESIYMKVEEDQEVNYKDLLASFILGWKVIFCLITVFIILGGIYGVRKARNSQRAKIASATDQKMAIKAALSETEALEVERVFSRYQVCQNYLDNTSRFNSAYQNLDQEKWKMKVAKYYIVSNVKNIYSFYTEMALSSDDYDEIYKIVYPEKVASGQEISDDACPVHFASSINWDNNYFIAENDNSQSKEATLVTVFINAETKNQCEKILNFVDVAFQKETKTLKEVDADLVCRQVDAHYSSDGKEFLDAIEKVNVDRLTIANNALATMKTYFINNFTKSQKDYFDYLNKEALLSNTTGEKVEGTSISGFSFKTIFKYSLAGAIVGVFLAGCWLFFIYMIDDRIKTSEELSYYRITILDTFYYEKGHSLFHKLARKIRGIDSSAGQMQEYMLVEDISILMNKTESKSVYLLVISNAEDDRKLAEKIQDKLKEEGLDVISGNPLINPEELKKLSDVDRVIMIVHMKDTKRNCVSKARDICDRYGRQIDGAVAIEVC